MKVELLIECKIIKLLKIHANGSTFLMHLKCAINRNEKNVTVERVLKFSSYLKVR